MNPHAAAFAAIMKNRRQSSSADNKNSSASRIPQYSTTGMPPAISPYQQHQIIPQQHMYQYQPLTFYNTAIPSVNQQYGNLPNYLPPYIQQTLPAPSQPPTYPSTSPQTYQAPPLATSFHSSRPKADSYRAPKAAKKEIFSCVSCDRHFPHSVAYQAHLQTHEKCTHPDCEFSAGKKVVEAHFDSSHGQYAGSGFKEIEVEGATFKVLLGSDAEEIKQWRKERKERFPTAEALLRKRNATAALEEAGGIDTNTVAASGKKRKIHASVADSHANRRQPAGSFEVIGSEEYAQLDDARVESATTSNTGRTFPCKYQYNGKTCKKGDACPFSHTAEPLLCNRFLSTGRCLKGFRCMFVHDKKLVQINDNKKEKKDITAVEQKPTQRGQLYLPDPCKGPTLLRKLLGSEILAQENIILQCLHYIRSQHYLQEPESASPIDTFADSSLLLNDLERQG